MGLMSNTKARLLTKFSSEFWLPMSCYKSQEGGANLDMFLEFYHDDIC